MSSRTGICYDYASLMCAMLRSQGIATRMIHGNTPQGYHAWNEVYMDGQGWVVVAGFSWNELGGASWVRFDTTFAAAAWQQTTSKTILTRQPVTSKRYPEHTKTHNTH
jgi:transglutaminase-like putative cysteine protease